ncbi:hypothetical protein K402DRAFT_102201 [Aulographum hederae CBS 113979]|uniref:Uncharacterized protein n=1 Tax=Aulographum hederae CBS 113979 TaxID=1176131 RepID=A0A6G1GYH9_9PEZI|nr:hypothetical protein K402DRAFT_102201 [Aulographum hederae CBS 113979]
MISKSVVQSRKNCIYRHRQTTMSGYRLSSFNIESSRRYLRLGIIFYIGLMEFDFASKLTLVITETSKGPVSLLKIPSYTLFRAVFFANQVPSGLDLILQLELHGFFFHETYCQRHDSGAVLLTSICVGFSYTKPLVQCKAYCWTIRLLDVELP